MFRQSEIRCGQSAFGHRGRGMPLLATSSVLALSLATVQPLAAQTVFNVNSPRSITAVTGATATPATGDIWNLNSTGIFLDTRVTVGSSSFPWLTINGNGNTLTLHTTTEAFSIAGPGTIALSNLTISGASATGNGGVIFAAVLTVNTAGAVAFTNNSAGYEGGVIIGSDILIGNANSTITFTGNSAPVGGGAIFAGGEVTIDGSAIVMTGNSTANPSFAMGGGAIFAFGDVSIGNAASTVTLSDNTAGTSGGAILSSGAVTLAGSAVTVTGNTATAGNGGAVSANSFILNATGPSQFSNNTAGTQGGAIFAQGDVTLNAAGGDVTFSRNMENTATTARANAIYLNNAATSPATATFNAAAGSAITFFDPIQNNAANGLIAVTKTGAGTVAFDGSLYTNPADRLSQVLADTTVQEGTFAVRNNAVYGALGADVSVAMPESSFTVDSGATLAGGIAGEVRADDFALNGTLNIAGAASPGNASGGFSTFTVTSSDVSFGAGSQVLFNTYLNDASVQRSDLLVLNLNGGATSGTASIFVTNVGGPGGLTTGNGILLVQTNNGTTAGAFTLGNPELRGGAFDYRLFQGGPDGSDPENWYLRSTFIGPTPPTPPTPSPLPIIGPELATYGVVQPMAQQLGRAMLGTHDERFGDLYAARPPCEPVTSAPPYTKAPVYTKAPTDCAYGWRPAVWGRLFGQQTSQPAKSGHPQGRFCQLNQRFIG